MEWWEEEAKADNMRADGNSIEENSTDIDKKNKDLFDKAEAKQNVPAICAFYDLLISIKTREDAIKFCSDFFYETETYRFAKRTREFITYYVGITKLDEYARHKEAMSKVMGELDDNTVKRLYREVTKTYDKADEVENYGFGYIKEHLKKYIKKGMEVHYRKRRDAKIRRNYIRI